MVKIAVKVQAENNGRKYALLIPAIRDSDGYVTISSVQAFAASQLIAAEAFPDQDAENRRIVREHNKRN